MVSGDKYKKRKEKSFEKAVGRDYYKYITVSVAACNGPSCVYLSPVQKRMAALSGCIASCNSNLKLMISMFLLDKSSS